jgi:hypothetical protein
MADDSSIDKQVRVVHRDALDGHTTQTPGMIREVAFDARNPDAARLSAFRSTVEPGMATGAHHIEHPAVDHAAAR